MTRERRAATGAVTVVEIDRPAGAQRGRRPDRRRCSPTRSASSTPTTSAVGRGAHRRGRHVLRGRRPQGRRARAAATACIADGDGPMGPTRMLLDKPVIAAVEGYAVAGGLELALWCDLRVAARDAVFGVFCRRWGVPLVDGGTVRLPRMIGHSHALDLILTGRGVTGDEALRMGLANRLVEPGDARRGRDRARHRARRAPAGMPARRPHVELRAVVADARRCDAQRVPCTARTLASGEAVAGAARFAPARAATAPHGSRSQDQEATREGDHVRAGQDHGYPSAPSRDIMSRPVVTATAAETIATAAGRMREQKVGFGRHRRRRRPRHRDPHRTRHAALRGRGFRRVDREGVGMDDCRARHGRSRRRGARAFATCRRARLPAHPRRRDGGKLVGIVSMRDLMRIAMIQPVDALAHEGRRASRASSSPRPRSATCAGSKASTTTASTAPSTSRRRGRSRTSGG